MNDPARPDRDSLAQHTAAYVSMGSTNDDASVDAASTINDGSRSPKPVDPKLGLESFGDYDILATIAHGGMGVVYKARDRKLNRVVALKMILPGRLSTDDAVRRFRTEAEATARLDHPGIVPVYEAGERDGKHYIAMAFVDGGSLAARVKEGPLPARDAAELVRQLANAIAYAHSKGIIHRDLKPGNILLTGLTGWTGLEINLTSNPVNPVHPVKNSSIPKITDFGLAKVLNEGAAELTETGLVMGTPAYMPPEQAAGRIADVGPAADIYSLGAILYCLLTGRPPFQAATPVETLRQVLEQEPAAPRLLNPGVPRDLETVALKCLQKDATKRYTSAAALADDLQRFLDNRPIVARPAGPIERGAKWVRRNPLATGLIVVLTLGMVASSTAGAIAVRQRNLAVEAEHRRGQEEVERVQAQRQRLIDTHLASARLALQRGAWREALSAYDRVEADGAELTIPMQLDKVRSWVSLSEVGVAQKELNRMAGRSDLGEHAALVDLFRGDLALGIDNIEAERLLNRALTGKLEPGDMWYARGQLARRMDTALDAFRQATEANRFHREARSFVILLLLVTGRYAEGLTEAKQAELLYPDDPQFQMLQGMCHDLRLDKATADRYWKRIEGVIPDDVVKLLRNILSMLPRLGELLAQKAGVSDGSDPFKSFQAVQAFNQLLGSSDRIAKLATPVKGDEGTITKAPTLRMPMAMQPLQRFLSQLRKFALADMQGRDMWTEIASDEKQFEEMNQLVDDVGDGLSRYWQAMIMQERAMLVGWGKTRNDPLFLQRMRDTAKAYDLARKTPGFIDARIVAQHGYIMALCILGSPARKGHDPEMTKLAAREVRDMITRGPLPPHIYNIYARAARNAADWNLAREVLDLWDRKKPNDFDALRQRIETELAARNYAAAAVAARKWTRLAPHAPESWLTLSLAVAKVREQVPELAVR